MRYELQVKISFEVIFQTENVELACDKCFFTKFETLQVNMLRIGQLHAQKRGDGCTKLFLRTAYLLTPLRKGKIPIK